MCIYDKKPLCFNKIKQDNIFSTPFSFIFRSLLQCIGAELKIWKQLCYLNYFSFPLCPPNGSLPFPITELSFYLLKGDSIFPHLYLPVVSLSISYWISSPLLHHKFEFPTNLCSTHLCLTSFSTYWFVSSDV